MPSAPDKVVAPLPPFQQQTELARLVSTPEYYHASIGSSGKTLEAPRYVDFVVAGNVDDTLTAADWQRAIDRIVEVNRGLCLRWEGCLGFSRWRSDGPPPRLHIIEHCDWDMNSSVGCEFIRERALSLQTGPTVEFIVAKCGHGRVLLILHSHHAIMDGMGAFHALHELFRALRGEPLLGTNAGFSDVDLMRSAAVPPAPSMHLPTCWLTGEPAGDAQGDDWWRIRLGPMRKQPMAHLAVAMAEFAHQFSDLPVLIAMPVDLRRHAPGLISTANFSNMVLVRLDKGDGVEVFQQRLRDLLSARRDVAYSPVFNWLRWLPMRWFDQMLSRTEANYRTRKPRETALISNLGKIDLQALSAPGFSAEEMLVLPIPGSAFSILLSVNGQLEITLNLPRVLSGQGRVEACIAFLQQRMQV